jgi:putative tryptophan/tyrosine transport system substrate-binding protein
VIVLRSQTTCTCSSIQASACATGTVPIVFVQVTDPVGGGIVESLARPGGNVTGFPAPEYVTSGKYLELLKQIAPRLTRSAVAREN